MGIKPKITPIYSHYIIDMSSNNNFVQNPTMEGDGNGVRGIEIELISNGTQYVVDAKNIIVSIAGTKPDTKHILNECTVTSEGYILVDVTSQMSAVKGRGDYCIVLMDKTTNSQLKSFPFYIMTTSAPFNISEIVSSDEFQLLTKTVTSAGVVSVEAQKQLDKMRELETEVSTNEKDRVSAESTRQKTFSTLMDTANSEVERLKKENDTATASAKLANQYAESAKADAGTATTKANEALTSANNAKNSETNAKTSETNAKASEVSASTSAQSAKTDAATATSKASSASASATNAAVSEKNAKASETSANASATTATSKATEASTYADLSKSYAVGTDGVIRENDTIDNAKHYYEQAKNISMGLQGALLPMGTIVFAELKNQTKEIGYMYNISDSFTTDSTFKEGSGYTYSAGTNVYYTADGYWDCLAGTMVTSVNGNVGDITFSVELISNTEPADQNDGDYWLLDY